MVEINNKKAKQHIKQKSTLDAIPINLLDTGVIIAALSLVGYIMALSYSFGLTFFLKLPLFLTEVNSTTLFCCFFISLALIFFVLMESIDNKNQITTSETFKSIRLKSVRCCIVTIIFFAIDIFLMISRPEFSFDPLHGSQPYTLEPPYSLFYVIGLISLVAIVYNTNLCGKILRHLRILEKQADYPSHILIFIVSFVLTVSQFSFIGGFVLGVYINSGMNLYTIATRQDKAIVTTYKDNCIIMSYSMSDKKIILDSASYEIVPIEGIEIQKIKNSDRLGVIIK